MTNGSDGRRDSRYANDTIRFSWETLRVLIQAKAKREMGKYEDTPNWRAIAKDIGIYREALQGFLRGTRPTMVIENVLPILHWLKIYDWRILAEGEGLGEPEGE